VAGLAARSIRPPGPQLAAVGVTLEADAPVVADVGAESAAATAGVQAGDRIVRIGGAEIATRNEAIDGFQDYQPGDDVEVVLERGGIERTIRHALPPSTQLVTDRRLAWFALNIADTIGSIFLRLIFMVVVPLVFSALVLGVAEIGDVRKLGRMGLRTLWMTLILSGASVAIGLTLANSVRPGARLSDEQREVLKKEYMPQGAAAANQAKQAKTVRETLLDLIPRNPLQEMVGAIDGSSPGGGMLAVMVFALFVGVAITLAPERTGTLVLVLQGVYDIAMVIIGLAMRVAPLGVAGIMFALSSRLGLDILTTLAWYVGTVIVGLALHMFGVYSLVAVVFARLSPRKFFGRISEVILTAFATSSSSVTLPTALRVTEKQLNVKREVSSFVLTVGSTANQNGTALFEGLTVLFLAQVFGVQLGITQQVTVVLMSVLAGIGTAGVPGGSLPLVAMVLESVGVPGQGIGIIIGVDRLLDMCRTTVNVTGDVLIATCVDRQERAAETTPLGK
jgi:DAACS family dicarboxylate/amino acid:cation (Na+ or H+) symporter